MGNFSVAAVTIDMSASSNGGVQEDHLDDLQQRAVAGDRRALESFVVAVSDDVHRIALRMVWDRHEAEDATQEILTKIVTKLGSFRGEASIRTWVYRVSVNHLLDRRKSAFENLSFEALADDLLDGLAEPLPRFQPELEMLANEVMASCTRAMLQCLDRDHRAAYLPGEILELSSATGAAVLQIEPATFRKRLSRARTRIRSFMTGNCGLINPSAACRCTLRINRATELGRLATPMAIEDRVSTAVREIDAVQRIGALMRASVADTAPEHVAASLRTVLAAPTALMDDR